MSLLGNIIWLIFGGFFAALGYIIGGILLLPTIIGIPFGLQSISLGIASLAPFGKELKEADNANNSLNIIFNIIWAVLFGWEIAFLYAICGIALGVLAGLLLGSLKLDKEVILNNDANAKKINEMPQKFNKKIEFSLKEGL